MKMFRKIASSSFHGKGRKRQNLSSEKVWGKCLLTNYEMSCWFWGNCWCWWDACIYYLLLMDRWRMVLGQSGIIQVWGCAVWKSWVSDWLDSGHLGDAMNRKRRYLWNLEGGTEAIHKQAFGIGMDNGLMGSMEWKPRRRRENGETDGSIRMHVHASRNARCTIAIAITDGVIV